MSDDKYQIVHTALWGVKEGYLHHRYLEIEINEQWQPIFTLVNLPSNEIKVRFNDNSFVILPRTKLVAIRYLIDDEVNAHGIEQIRELKATNEFLADELEQSDARYAETLPLKGELEEAQKLIEYLRERNKEGNEKFERAKQINEKHRKDIQRLKLFLEMLALMAEKSADMHSTHGERRGQFLLIQAFAKHELDRWIPVYDKVGRADDDIPF